MYIPSLVLVLSFFLFIFGPSSVEQVTFVPIHKTLAIKTNKNLPPYIAYETTLQSDTGVEKNEWDLFKNKAQTLMVEDTPAVEVPPKVQRIVLHEVVIQKDLQRAISEIHPNQRTLYRSPDSFSFKEEENAWKADLTVAEKARIEKVEQTGAIANFYKAEQKVYNVEPARIQTRNPTNSEKVQVRNFPNERQTEVKDTVIASNNLKFDANSLGKEYQIKGHIEIHKGLAITNDHHIEFRRKDEGIFQERGLIDIGSGSYTIKTHEIKGFLVAQLVTSKGDVIGEGSARISLVNFNESTTSQEGPKIRIFPKSDVSGQVKDAYKTESADPAPEKTMARFLGGIAEVDVKKDGKIQYGNLIKGSTTLLRSEAPGYVPTQQIILAGSDFESILYPENMVKSFKNIVSELRMSNYNDPEMPVIWGQVVQDGKGIAGIEVNLEGIEADVIYFNEFHLPDANLKPTSLQGGFAILNPPAGYHSLIAKKGDAYYAHQNTIVDMGVISYVKMESSLKTESVNIKVYDAFTGQSEMAVLSMQGVEEKIQVENGLQVQLMPFVSRSSLLEAFPRQGYLSAEYLYNESLGYVHVPLISEKWFSWLTSQLKINQSPARSLIIGFVPEEDYEVGIINSEDIPDQNILYFNAQGEIVKSKIGTAGGGFIIFNAPVGPLEIATQLTKTQKTMSKLVPAEPGKLFVLNYRSE